MTDTTNHTTALEPRATFGLRNPIERHGSQQAITTAVFDRELWERLQQMELDDPTADTPIGKRLEAEHKWSEAETRQAISEYKRFVYLTQRAGFEVTPSRPVDLVWHEHLMHTRHYWGTMCAEVLRNDLHHKPGLGGEADANRLSDQYSRTLDAYRTAFGFDPPADLWPRPASPHKSTAGKAIFAGLLVAGVVAGIATRIWPLVIVCIFLLIAVMSAVSNSRKVHADRGGCGAGCGSGGIGSSGCGDSDGGSCGDSGGDGGGCGGGGD